MTLTVTVIEDSCKLFNFIERYSFFINIMLSWHLAENLTVWRHQRPWTSYYRFLIKKKLSLTLIICSMNWSFDSIWVRYVERYSLMKDDTEYWEERISYLFSFIHNDVIMYNTRKGDLLETVLLIWEVATKAMVKLTFPRSTSHIL